MAKLIKVGYRGYTIEASPYTMPGHCLQYSHDDYDGSEDIRCGTCKSVDEAKEIIDDLEQRFDDGESCYEKGAFW